MEGDAGKKKKEVKEMTDKQKEKKKNSVLFRIKKNTSEKLATSKAGKVGRRGTVRPFFKKRSPRLQAALKKIMDPELQELIVRVKHVVAVQTGNEQEAEDLEQNALKIIVKGESGSCLLLRSSNSGVLTAANLHSAGIITEKDLKPVDEPLRKALRLILKVYDNLHKLPLEMQAKTLEEKFYVIAILFENVQEALKKLLTPHLKEASITRIDDAFRIMANHVFFRDVWANKSLDEDVRFAMAFMRDLALDASDRPPQQ